MQAATDKFPITRVLNLEYGQTMRYDYSSKLRGKKLQEGKVNSWQNFRASANVNFIKKQNGMLGITLNYRYFSADIDKPDWNSAAIHSQKVDLHYHFTALNFTYFSKLLNKTVIYSGSVGAERKPESI
ncbi:MULTISPECIES: hypothetical protein [Bacteroidota]|uniref:hypothetical protein n=1 Tax=Bacteroidota TaxID=976 RepID=UPI00241ED9EF|nr:MULTISPECIES: hypothetical protein [Bacteroidota]